jgi:mitochondrial chaperone BCS1
MSIYAVNLTELNDRTLKIAIGTVPANSIILFEDIDCMKAGNRRPEQASGLSKESRSQGARR